MHIVHSGADIVKVLRHGLTPITDNQSALIELGFSRAYPQLRSGYDAAVWERSIDYPSTVGPRKLVRQRAILRVAESGRG